MAAAKIKFFDVETILTEQALPAAGDYVQGDAKYLPRPSRGDEDPSNLFHLSFEVNYSKGAAAASGACALLINWIAADGDAPITWFIDPTTLKASEGPIEGPDVSDGEAHLGVFTTLIPSGYEMVRVDVAEIGDTANPGTASVKMRSARR